MALKVCLGVSCGKKLRALFLLTLFAGFAIAFVAVLGSRVLDLLTDDQQAEINQLGRSLGAAALLLARDLRSQFLAPFMQAVVALTAFLSSLVAADRLFHVYAALYYLDAKRRPELAFSHAPLPDPTPLAHAPGDINPQDAALALQFPTVVVQLPMFNEKEMAEHIIDACCHLVWPWSRLLIQVLDDSTDAETVAVTRAKVDEWAARGIPIIHHWRSNRRGFKAGAMMDAEAAIENYELRAIFDADFAPAADFLLQTVPYLKDNPGVAMVQARWTFANAGETLLTRVQEIGLNYHVKCEQLARFGTGNFFNFNGTAGVWRSSAIIDAGGWNCRTTVEDMDLSLRAFLKGWKFVFLYDVTCINELPSNYDAYRKQQHRWSCGPMQLARKGLPAIWTSKVQFTQKVYLLLFFFGSRMCAAHIVAFVFYGLLAPICILTPEVLVPAWALVYVPVTVVLTTTYFTPNGWAYAAHFVLYENAMSIVKVAAMIAGLFELPSAHEWVVTAKVGGWLKAAKSKLALSESTSAGLDALGLKSSGASMQALPVSAAPAGPPPPAPPPAGRKIYWRELVVSSLFLGVAVYGALIHASWHYAVYCGLQGAVFALFGLNLVI